jgi:hypothetical protein
MATIAAVQPASSKRELRTQVSVLNGKLADAQAEIRTWQTSLDAETAKLGALQNEYNQACKSIARGQNADPEKIQKSMHAIEARIVGLKGLIASEQATVATLRGQLQGPTQALSTMEQRDAEDREAEEVQAKLEKGKRFLLARNEAQTNFEHMVRELRNGVYQSERNRNNAKNLAVSLERLSVGIIS